MVSRWTRFTQPHTADIVEPCPLCRSTANVFDWWQKRWWIKCSNPMCHLELRSFQTKPEALAAWNARTPDPEAAAEIKALREAGQRVLDGLNARIDAAPSDCVPLFEGIAELVALLSKIIGKHHERR